MYPTSSTIYTYTKIQLSLKIKSVMTKHTFSIVGDNTYDDTYDNDYVRYQTKCTIHYQSCYCQPCMSCLCSITFLGR